jgi:hypothetical protein
MTPKPADRYKNLNILEFFLMFPNSLTNAKAHNEKNLLLLSLHRFWTSLLPSNRAHHLNLSETHSTTAMQIHSLCRQSMVLRKYIYFLKDYFTAFDLFWIPTSSLQYARIEFLVSSYTFHFIYISVWCSGYPPHVVLRNSGV